MLEIANLYVSYGDMSVLRDLSLKISAQETVSLVGSNGVGKTTTLNAISGLIPSRSGSITFLGERIDNWSSQRIVNAGVVQVPEGRRIFPLLKVAENLRLGSYSRRARQKRGQTLDEIYTMFPILKARASQMAGTLSGGEQQMLAIGRALMSEPLLLMLDEPSLGLAPLVVRQVFRIVETINKKGTTVFLVEQNVHQALSISQRGYVLEEGSISLSDAGKALLANEHVKKAYLGM